MRTTTFRATGLSRYEFVSKIKGLDPIVTQEQIKRFFEEKRIRNIYSKHQSNEMNLFIAKVNKISSAYKLKEYQEKYAEVQTIKNNMKVTAVREAGELRRKFTQRKSMTNIKMDEETKTLDDKHIAIEIKDEDHQNPKLQTKESLKSDKAIHIDQNEFSKEYQELVHKFNEENKKVTLAHTARTAAGQHPTRSSQLSAGHALRNLRDQGNG